HLRRGRIDLRPQHRLHAPRQQQHAASVTRGGPGGRARARRESCGCGQLSRQQRPRETRQRERRANAAGVRHDLAQQVALEARRSAPAHTLLDDRTADVEKPSVLYARGAGALARPAGETAVEMQLRARGDRRALEQLLHEIDAPARTVELIAEQLVSGTGGKTEAAVYARAQDRMRLAPGGGVFDEVRERGAHGFPDPIGTQQRGAVTARVPAKDSKLIRAAAVRTAGLRARLTIRADSCLQRRQAWPPSPHAGRGWRRVPGHYPSIATRACRHAKDPRRP